MPAKHKERGSRIGQVIPLGQAINLRFVKGSRIGQGESRTVKHWGF